MSMFQQLKNRQTTNSPKESFKGISYRSLLIFVVAFLLGIGCILLLQNSLSEKISISTFDIINFVVVIGLAVASAVLAMVAIVLGKKSEDVIVRRSDKSIEYQTEIFKETLKILSRVEASSNVTEKRIGDAMQTLGSVNRGLRDEDRLSKERRRIFSSGPSIDAQKQIEKIRLEDEQQQKYHNGILEEIRKINSIKIDKVGNGSFTGTGNQLVDGSFEFKNVKFSLSIFYIDDPYGVFSSFRSELLRSYFLNLANELLKNTFHNSFLVFNTSVDKDLKFMELYENVTAILSDDIKRRLTIITGDIQNVVKEIIKHQKIKKDE